MKSNREKTGDRWRLKLSDLRKDLLTGGTATFMQKNVADKILSVPQSPDNPPVAKDTHKKENHLIELCGSQLILIRNENVGCCVFYF